MPLVHKTTRELLRDLDIKEWEINIKVDLEKDPGNGGVMVSAPGFSALTVGMVIEGVKKALETTVSTVETDYPVCEKCIDFGMPPNQTMPPNHDVEAMRKDTIEYMQEMGSYIAEHPCIEDDGGDVQCACGCKEMDRNIEQERLEHEGKENAPTENQG